MAGGRRRLRPNPNVAVHGNVDPGALGSKGLNLGHGIVVGTPAENVAHFLFFFRLPKEIRY